MFRIHIVVLASVVLLQGTVSARSRAVLRLDQLGISSPPTVRIFLTDLDSDLNPIVDRKPEHYRLLVDGVPQTGAGKVERLHKTDEKLALTLVIQVSPAMRDVLTEIVEGSKRLVGNLPRGAKVGLVAYTDVVVQEVKPTAGVDVTQSIDALRIREEALAVQLPDAVKDALEGLDSASLPKQRMMVVISDGLTADLNFAVFSELGRRARDKGVMVHTIGFAPLEPARLRTLQELSKRGGGTTREPKDATGVTQALSALQEEIRNQLRLTYTAPKFFDGKLHDFQIETPGGQASNIVGVELPRFAPKVKEDKVWYKRPAFLVGVIAGGQVFLVALVLVLLRWRRAGAARAALQRDQYMSPVYDEVDEQEEQDDEDEEDEDAILLRRRRSSSGRGGPSASPPARTDAPASRSVVDESRRSGIQELMQPDPFLLSSSPDLPAGVQVPDFGGGELDPTRESSSGLAAYHEPPGSAYAPILPEPPPSREPGLLLPNPEEFLRGRSRPVRPGSQEMPPLAAPAEGSGAVSVVPHPDDFLRQMGARPVGLDATIDAPSGSMPPAQPQRTPGAIAGSGIPLPQGGPGRMEMVVPTGLPPEAGVQPGRFLDRKTKVIAVEEMGRLEHVAWVVQLDDIRLEAPPRTIPIHDGFSIGSDPGCDLQLQGPGIFPRHSMLSVDPGGFRLETTGSRGETLSQLLADNDHFFITDREFAFKVASRISQTPIAAVRLEVLEGMDEGRKLSLPEGQVLVLGSHSTCNLMIRGSGVDPQHAIAARNGRICTISDLGTARGIWFDGQQMGFKSLQAGEEILIGNVRMVYTYEDPGNIARYDDEVNRTWNDFK